MQRQGKKSEEAQHTEAKEVEDVSSVSLLLSASDSVSFGGFDAESEEMDEGSQAGHEHEDVDNQEQSQTQIRHRHMPEP